MARAFFYFIKKMYESVKMLKDGFCHAFTVHLFHAFSVNIAGTVSIFQGMIHRFFNGISLV